MIKTIELQDFIDGKRERYTYITIGTNNDVTYFQLQNAVVYWNETENDIAFDDTLVVINNNGKFTLAKERILRIEYNDIPDELLIELLEKELGN